MQTPSASADQQLVALRPYLFKIAYNMTGTVEDAEDVVQDVYEKWLKTSRPEVENLKMYLARMVVNHSINRLNELKAARESYTGFWLPEPYITLEVHPETPSIDYGLLMLLERLNPLERAVFILRESFSEKYDVIAELTEQSEENCRQLLHRAKTKMQSTTAHPVDSEKHRSLTEAFLMAMDRLDRSALEELLVRDIELYNDGGGKRAAALKPLFGLDKVVKFLIGVTQQGQEKGDTYTYQPGFINGRPAALLYTASGELDAVLSINFDETGISRVLFVRNPDKLNVR